MSRPRSSHQRYLSFVQDYKRRCLDDTVEACENEQQLHDPTKSRSKRPGKRRKYLRQYLRWLWPYRFATGMVLALALIGAGLQMLDPLFMRFIVDRVLLNSVLDAAARFRTLNLVGVLYLAVTVASNFVDALKGYRHRLLNARLMLALREPVFERLMHLPLPKLWDIKIGGILSRLTGDVDTTTELTQMAIVSPSVSIIRLIIVVVVLMALNWRLGLTALAIVPGLMLISFIAARRIRPIYRSLRKDAEEIDGQVGEVFSGIRVVRAFRREMRELFEYMRGRHTVVRKELFAQRRELLISTSWVSVDGSC